jgi:hypothetical protein
VSLRNTTEEYSVHRHVKKSREKSTARKFLYNKNLTPCVRYARSSTISAALLMLLMVVAAAVAVAEAVAITKIDVIPAAEKPVTRSGC